MKKRLLSLLCVLALCLGLLPGTAWAAEEVSYVEYSWNENTSTLTSTPKSVTGCTTVSSISTTTWSEGWYVVSGSVSSTSDTTIRVNGTVNLILTAGSSLTLNYGTISINDNSTLNIYGQEGGSGTLTLGGNHRDANPGIGLGSGSTLNIHGGKVNATGYTNSATKSAPGIDVGGSGTLTVYGGEVTAEAGTYNGAGIRVTSSGIVSIYGGTVTATGASNKSANGHSGAGIGGNGAGGSGAGETCGTVNIYGGTVTATGGSGGSGASAGIGGGQGGTISNQGGGGNVTITGGTVTAIGGKSTADNAQAPGIGGAVYNNKGDAGSFSTGTGGSAVITTTGGIQADTSGCSAIIDNTVYGTVTLPDSQYGKTLTVSENANLTIPNGAPLSSSITVASGGTLTVSGTVTNTGTITVDSGGTLNGSGTINNQGSGTVTGDTGNVKVTYPSTVEVSSSTSGTAVLGQEVTFTATVTGSDTVGTPTGTVQFKDNGNGLGTAQTLNNEGKATYTTSTLDIGEHTITAEYIPADGSSYQGSTSSALTFTVVGDVASIRVQTQPTTMTYTTGQALDLTGLEITVSYADSTYTQDITWSADSGITAKIDNVKVDNNTVLSASQHNGKAVTITYEGQSAQTSALSVSKANQTGFAFTEESPNEVDYSPNGTFTVKAEGGEGTGAVTYTVNEGGGDVVNINSTSGEVTILKAGTATITATKAADGDYNKATATLTVTVSKASQTGFGFTTDSPKTVTYGEGTFTVTAEGGPGSGDVTYEVTEGTDIISISDNTVTILKAGEATITATKAADDKYSAATAILTVTVSPLPVELEWSTPTSFTYDGSAKTVTAKVSNAVDGDTFTLTYEDNTGTAVGNYTAKVTDLGNDNYTLTGATGVELTWSIGGASIAGAEVTLSQNSFTYDGQSHTPTVTVKLNGNTLNANTDYTVDFGGDSINAGTYTVTVTGTGNYSGTATSQPTYTITKADQAALSITSSGPATFGQNYTLTTSGGSGSGAVTITVSNGTGAATVNGNILTPSKAGTVTVTAVKAGDNNYNDGTSVSVTITINKGTYDGTTDVSGTVLANWPGEVTLPAIPDGASYGTPTSSDVTGLSITDGNILHYTGGSGIVKDQTYTVTVPVTGATNYDDYNITVTLTGTDKQVLNITGVTAQNGTYNGQAQTGYTGTPSAEGFNGDFTVTYNTADGKAPTNAGNYSVTIAIPDSDPQYVGSIVLEFATAKKPLTVSAPSASVYVGDNAPLLALTYTGLVDGESVTPSEDPVFTITKSDGTVIALDEAVKTAGTYTITWSNADQGFTGDENYDIQTVTAGTLTVSVRSSGGGGSSGGGSSNTTTETTKNPDGSTMTTVTSSNGTVTETTKNPDGSQEVVETKKDGTVTTTTTDTTGNKTQVVENTDGTKETTITNKDGSSSATTVDETGKTQAEVKLPAAVVEDAQGEAVTLPMPEVPITTDRETAPTVTVDLPSGTSAKVEIPVEDVTPGTVAVLVKSNGDEEIIKTSVTTGNGVAVTLNDGDTVKIVDNSKTFADVPDNYWGAEAVDFTSSRELFAGTSATTFAPNTAMTRAMIVTVLARFEGVDTTTGSTWYEAGQQWAMENGVSDGTNMDASLTREQLATMLWRYAGSPSVSDNLSGYTDADTVSSYAQQAMAWCVEHGIIGGTTTTTLSPQGQATRAQVATILMRFIETGI